MEAQDPLPAASASSSDGPGGGGGGGNGDHRGRSRGSILEVCSILGLVAMPADGLYIISKHGVLGLVKTDALDYGKRGIRVSAVCPGFVDTTLLMPQYRVLLDWSIRKNPGILFLITVDMPILPHDQAIEPLRSSVTAKLCRNAHCPTKHAAPSFDSSAPIGPVLVAQEQISDPHSLRIRAIHNRNVVQDSSRKEMIFGVSEMMHSWSEEPP
ncbi:hypothetical protein HO173_004771 [Letharia columbiana]|uniref:Fumarylacetoacetase-like C-terminal domain-containing protein n=1 Tax=Letharia columbiana TaxID=112416 RepID=A0A8H6FYW1_9LECA|nr:uncharacterized protein HO173_004771 [Letharia columbiana]KAF6237302.1 hypothetical protein HO173_004771 [Letharia columbiana]